MRGKIAIIVMLSLAVSLAGFAWYWNYQRSAKARAFWGSRAATIRFANKVDAFSSDHPEDAVDISGAPGLLNARTSLMSDDGFDWSAQSEAQAASGDWGVGVRFTDDNGEVTLRFSDQSDRMLVVESDQAIALNPKTAQGWKSYLKQRLKGSNEALNRTSSSPELPRTAPQTRP
jgi:hypothetical protein